MAFSLSGIYNRLGRPGLCKLGSYLPEVDLQVRGYAARKGTREKALKKKRALKMKRAAQAAREEKRKKISVSHPDIKRTEIDQLLPPTPKNIDVYFAKYYKPAEYSVLEAVNYHKENLHPDVLDVEKAKIQVFIELNMIAEKQTKVINPWKNILCYPHAFETGFKKKILVLCKDNLVDKAIEAGADLAGGVSLIKKIKKGEVDLTIYDRVIGQLAFWDEINSLRSKLKRALPKTQDGSLAVDFLSAIPKFKFGVEYVCNLSASEFSFGWIEAQIGTANLESEHVEENFLTLLKDIYLRKPKREGDFITVGYCSAPPSRERFRLCIDWYLDELAKLQTPEEAVERETQSESSAGAAENKI